MTESSKAFIGVYGDVDDRIRKGCVEFGAGMETASRTVEATRRTLGTGDCGSRAPDTVVASAVYVGMLFAEGGSATQDEVADRFDVSPTSVRDAYKAIATEYHEILVEEGER